ALHALEAAAFEDATRYVELGLDLLPDSEVELRGVLLGLRGRTLRSMGRWADAERTWSEAIEMLEAAGEHEAEGDICYEMAIHYAWISRWEECLEVSGRGLSALGDQPSLQRAALLGLTAVVLSLAGS